MRYVTTLSAALPSPAVFGCLTAPVTNQARRGALPAQTPPVTDTGTRLRQLAALILVWALMTPGPAAAAGKREPHLCDTPYEGRVFTVYPCSFYDTPPDRRDEFVPGMDEKPQLQSSTRPVTEPSQPRHTSRVSGIDFTQYFDGAEEFKRQARRCNNYAFHQRGGRAECTRTGRMADGLAEPMAQARFLLDNQHLANSTDQINHAYMLVNIFGDGKKLWTEAVERINER